MTLDQLQLLVAIADSPTLTEAAKKRHLSQPAATHQLRQLEQALGVTLFERHHRRLTLTQAGQTVLRRARLIVQESHAIRRDLEDLSDLSQGEVRLGGGPTATIHLLPRLISDFHALYPGIRFYVREAHTHEVLDLVARGGLDLGITTLPCQAESLTVVPWRHDQIVIVGWPGCPLSQARIRPEALSGAPFIVPEHGSPLRERVEVALSLAGIEPDIVMELYSPEAAKAHVMAGLGYTAIGTSSVADELAQGTLVAIQVEDLQLTRQLGIAYRSASALAPAAEAFLAHLLTDK